MGHGPRIAEQEHARDRKFTRTLLPAPSPAAEREPQPNTGLACSSSQDQRGDLPTVRFAQRRFRVAFVFPSWVRGPRVAEQQESLLSWSFVYAQQALLGVLQALQALHCKQEVSQALLSLRGSCWRTSGDSLFWEQTSMKVDLPDRWACMF